MRTAASTPSPVMRSHFHSQIILVPGVKNRLKNAVITISTTTAFRPFTIYPNGTFEILITAAKNTVISKSPAMPRPANTAIRKSIVPDSLTRGSSLCISDSAG